ncbi:MAG: hypothetical protein IIA45_05160 [Bacteroidetes bacterium]|nr:hypothetical protein [Bacteroidota bacterium]
MKYYLLLLIATLLLFFTFDANAQKMNNKRMGKILNQVAKITDGQAGYWEITYEGIEMVVITDENHNRMRIITPLAYINELGEEVFEEVLEANFHTALDVKYAISDDIMWTVFIHPLKELSTDEFKDGLKQVYYATVTFGTTYSSTDLVFPAVE